MKNAAHFADPVFGIDHYRLRGIKAFALMQFPAEIGRIDAHQQPGGVVEITFAQRRKIPRINKIKAVSFTAVFICVFFNQCGKRILAVPRYAALAFNPLHAV